jgi:hypothetical protein
LLDLLWSLVNICGHGRHRRTVHPTLSGSPHHRGENWSEDAISWDFRMATRRLSDAFYRRKLYKSPPVGSCSSTSASHSETQY